MSRVTIDDLVHAWHGLFRDTTACSLVVLADMSVRYWGRGGPTHQVASSWYSAGRVTCLECVALTITTDSPRVRQP